MGHASTLKMERQTLPCVTDVLTNLMAATPPLLAHTRPFLQPLSVHQLRTCHSMAFESLWMLLTALEVLSAFHT